MHIEMSLDSQQNSESAPSNDQGLLSAEDTQTISGSQVACSFGRLDAQREKQNQGSWQGMALASLSAVIALAGLYAAAVLLL